MYENIISQHFSMIYIDYIKYQFSCPNNFDLYVQYYLKYID